MQPKIAANKKSSMNVLRAMRSQANDMSHEELMDKVNETLSRLGLEGKLSVAEFTYFGELARRANRFG